MHGGSGDEVDQIRYTSMFSLHKTEDIIIKKLKMKNNSKYDDMLHIVYCTNITIDDAILENAYSDAIDVDMSKKIIIRKRSKIKRTKTRKRFKVKKIKKKSFKTKQKLKFVKKSIRIIKQQKRKIKYSSKSAILKLVRLQNKFKFKFW